MSAEGNIQDIRRYTDRVLAWLRGRGKIVIIIHDNPDPDCLASALALRHLFMAKLSKEAVIAFSGIIARSENLAMAKHLDILLSPLDLLNLDDFQTVCMLDTQPGTGNNSFPMDRRVDILIDHHPLREASTLVRWRDVREDYGVTATILYEYLLAQEVTIGGKLATALFYAIKSETQDLGREAGRPDREAYINLFPATNKELLYEITHPKLPREYFLTINTALENARIYGGVLTACLGGVMFPEIVAEMADFLLRLEKVEAVLCMGLYAGEVIISMRTGRLDINAGEVINRVVIGLGSAGGHGMTAGGKIDRASTARMTLNEIENLLTKRLLSELSVCDVEPQRLLGQANQRQPSLGS